MCPTKVNNGTNKFSLERDGLCANDINMIKFRIMGGNSELLCKD